MGHLELHVKSLQLFVTVAITFVAYVQANVVSYRLNQAKISSASDATCLACRNSSDVLTSLL